MKRRASSSSSQFTLKRVKVTCDLPLDYQESSPKNISKMATILPQSVGLQEKLFASHEDSKYLGGEMDYTYGDNKQKMTTKAEDAKTLLSNAPGHLLPVIKNFLSGSSVVSVAVNRSHALLI